MKSDNELIYFKAEKVSNGWVIDALFLPSSIASFSHEKKQVFKTDEELLNFLKEGLDGKSE